ncbi:MAG: glycerophosphodiester phosphodiesterase [Ardenticatenaceae bacterium]|nr:glycerophosphodiester phosphodiesterase [Ardenticatenaceae bacterium]
MNDQKNLSVSSPPPKRRRRRECLVFPVILLALAFYYALYFLLRGPLPANPQLIAHRGGADYNPENTMAAFRHAVEMDADWLEMDVQRTQDGVLVVIHDETVDRTTNGVGNVGDFTLEQLRALDAGNGEQIPTFEEVIALAKDVNVGLLPEAKSPSLYPNVETEMVNAVVEADYLSQTVFQSFEMEAVENLHRANAAVVACPLYRLWWEVDASAPPGDAPVLCPMAEMLLVNPWLVREAHRAGREVYVWFGVLENPMMMRTMLAFGVDGLMTNDPLMLGDVLNR